jgi:hypothetical protein
VLILSTSTKHYWCRKFCTIATRATRITGAAFFKHKYLTNPSITPEDLVIAVAENLTQALKTSIPQHLQVSTTQALNDLSEVCSDASHKYSSNPTIHIPNAPPLHPHWELTESLRVSPTPLGSPPPRGHTTTISLTAPSILPTCAPTNVQIPLFPPNVPSASPWHNTVQRQLGTAPSPTTPITHQIMPHVPPPPTHKTLVIPTNSQPGHIG